MTLSGRERTLFFATAGAAALGVVWFLLVDPALTRLEKAGEKEAALGAQEREIAALMRKAPAIRESIESLESRIPASAPETMESEFNVFLKQVSENSKATPSSVGLVRRRKLPEDFEEFIFDVNLECDMGRLTDYLFELEKKSNRLVKISKLSIARSRSRSGERDDLSVNMTLSTVVKPLPGGGAGEGGSDEPKSR